MNKRLLSVCGWLLLGLAALGIPLPVLPTTPFVLAAATCFSFSNPTMFQRLLSSRVFGPYIEGWRAKQGITVLQKARAILTLWILLTISIIVNQKLWLAILLIAIGIAVTIHLLCMKTRKD